MTTAEIQSNGQVLMTPRRSALLAGHDNTVDVLVRVQAPDTIVTERHQRPPMGIALVLDRSGSMAGRPLEEAKRCARFMVSRLTAADSVAVVQFDDTVNVLVEAAALSTLVTLDRIIEAINSGGQTNLHGGWLAGAEQLAPFASMRSLQRVILLSDGCANHGLTDSHAITRQCADLAAAGVTTSTYGLGKSFNEALMVAMAEAGRGNHYYGASAEDLFEPFNQEFDLLSNLWMRNVVLEVHPVPGVKAVVMNAYASAGSEESWRLPDIAAGSEAWAMIRLTVPSSLVTTDVRSLLAVAVRGAANDGEPAQFAGSLRGLAPLPPTAFSAVSEDELVARRGTELEASALLMRCRVAAAADDWVTVEAVLADALVRFGGNIWVSDIVQDMQELAHQKDRMLMMKEAMYSSSSLARRITSSEETADSSTDQQYASFLRRKTSQGRAQFIRPEDLPGTRK